MVRYAALRAGVSRMGTYLGLQPLCWVCWETWAEIMTEDELIHVNAKVAYEKKLAAQPPPPREQVTEVKSNYWIGGFPLGYRRRET